MAHINCFWHCVKNTFNWLFRSYKIDFGEMELLCGEYEISLPIPLDNCNKIHHKIKEFWTSVSECGHPVCHGDESFNWVSYRIFNDEIIVKAKIKTQKAVLKWFIIS